MPGQLSTDELRANAVERHVSTGTRLQDELDKMVKLLQWARTCLENELQSGMGYKQLAISDKDLRKLKDLAASMNSAVEAKIKLSKSEKALAENMTPEEEYSAVWVYLRSLSIDKLMNMWTNIRRARGQEVRNWMLGQIESLKEASDSSPA